MYNRHLAKKTKPNVAIYYGELFARMEMLYNKESLSEDNYFSYTVEQMLNFTGVPKKSQQNAREILVKMGLIEAVRRGNPYRWYFKILLDKDSLHKAFIG